MISVYIYIMFILVEPFGEIASRDQLGYAILIVVIFTVIVNLLKTSY